MTLKNGSSSSLCKWLWTRRRKYLSSTASCVYFPITVKCFLYVKSAYFFLQGKKENPLLPFHKTHEKQNLDSGIHRRRRSAGIQSCTGEAFNAPEADFHLCYLNAFQTLVASKPQTGDGCGLSAVSF